MGMFDYAMMLAAIIIGLALTHLMQGIAGLISGKVKVWWVHLLWVAFMLLTSVSWWWSEYLLRDLPALTFSIYVFILTYAFGIYLASALLFPPDLTGKTYEDYFIANRNWFFGLQIGLGFIDLADSVLKGRAHVEALGTEYFVSTGAFIILAIIGIVTPRRGIQAFIALTYFIYQITWLGRLFQRMQ